MKSYPNGKLIKFLLVFRSSLNGSGDVYEGQLKDDQANGYGCMTYAGGGTYKGFWLDDSRHGEGVLINRVGKYTGTFYHGIQHGRGTYQYANGDHYDGKAVVSWRFVSYLY